MWSGDLAVLMKVVELYEATGENFEPERVLEAFPDEEHDAVRQSLRRLSAHGYLETFDSTPSADDRSVRIYMITDAATSARVESRPRIVEQVYLGTEDEVIARLTAGPGGDRACPRPRTAGSVTSRRHGGCLRGWTRSP